MKLKFFFLMISLVIVVTVALALPLIQLGNLVLTRLSRNSTENAISILSNTAGGGFYQYVSGTSREKRQFKITLQEGLIASAKNWGDIVDLFVIDEKEEIIAHSQPRLIGSKYDNYRRMDEFKKKINNIIKTYLKNIDSLNSNIEKTTQIIKINEAKVISIQDFLNNKKNNKDIGRIITDLFKSIFINKKNVEKKINEYRNIIKKNKIERNEYKKELIRLQRKIKSIEKNPISVFEKPIQIDNIDSYTIIYPIKMTFKDKFRTVGIFFATISTQFITKTLLWAIIISGVITVLVIILSFFLIGFYAKIIINPLIVLTEGVKQVAEGNLDMRIPVKGKDEIAVLGKEFNNMTKIWREKSIMEKYVSKSTVSMIKKLDHSKKNAKPQRKKTTIFFSDIRGFTAYSENHDPFTVVNSINSIFDIQVQIIHKYDGDIDKFVGDEIMAEFPTPAKAFNAALDIQDNINVFNRTRKDKLQIGIGINYGEAVVGSIGSKDAMDWTAIGDVVNIAARLCQVSPPGKIVVSQNVYKNQKTSLKAIKRSINVKGKKNKLNVYVF